MSKSFFSRLRTGTGRLRSGAAVGLPLAVLLAVAGCGAPSEQGAASEIAIGLPHPLTGIWAEPSQNAVNGALMAIEDVNKGGGITAMGGAKLKGVSGDTGSTDPGQGSSVARRLIENDQVSAMIGSNVSAWTLTASTAAEQAGVPMMTQSFSDQITNRGYKYIFQVPPTSSKIGKSLIPYVQDAYAAAGKNIRRVAVLASNDAAIQAQGKSAIDGAKAAGLEVVSEAFFPQDLTDATVLAQDVVRNNAEIVYLGGPTGATVTVVQTLRSLGYKGPIVGLGGGGILEPGFGKMLGDNVNGVLSLSVWNWDMPNEGLADVTTRYKEKFKQPFMPPVAGESYAAVWMIKAAIEKGGSSKPEDIAIALREADLNSGPASFMPGGKIKFNDVGQNETSIPILIQWQDGVTRTVWPEKIQEAKPQ